PADRREPPRRAADQVGHVPGRDVTEVPEPVDAVYPDGTPKAFWVALVVGWAIIVAGVRGLLINAHSPMPTNPSSWAGLLLKVSLFNDLVLLPLVFVIGRGISRLAPAT